MNPLQLDREQQYELHELPIKPLRDHVIVDPLYDSDKLGSIYLPQDAKNPQAQQGYVVASGPSAEFHPFVHILFEPYNAVPFKYEDHEYLLVHDKTIIGSITDLAIYPRSTSVIVQPEFPPAGPTRHGSILLLNRVFENPPIPTGLIVRTGSKVTQFRPGDRVVLPPISGHEVGLSLPDMSGVFYFLNEQDILATVLPDA